MGYTYLAQYVIEKLSLILNKFSYIIWNWFIGFVLFRIHVYLREKGFLNLCDDSIVTDFLFLIKFVICQKGAYSPSGNRVFTKIFKVRGFKC